MIAFKNRQELIDFVESCRDSESNPEEAVDELIQSMVEAGEVTNFALQAERHLKGSAIAVDQLGETEGSAMIAALTGIGFALLSNGENDEMFYAASLADDTGEVSP